MSSTSKKKRMKVADPDVLQNELLKKADELRLLKQRMHELSEENKKVKTTAVRLEKLAKRDGNNMDDSVTLLNPRDAASTAAMIDEQKRLLEEKDRKIKALLAGARMENIGGKKISGSNPAAVYGVKRPTKKVLQQSRPSTATTNRMAASGGSKAGLGSSRGRNNNGYDENETINQPHDDDYSDEPDHQSAPLTASSSRTNLQRSPSASSIRPHQASPTLSRSPSRSSTTPRHASNTFNMPASQNNGGDGGISESKDSEQHYLEFNKRLQERLNSSTNFHRSALDSAVSGAMNNAGNTGPINIGFFDDNGGDGGGGGGNDNDGPPSGDMNELVWIRRELRQKKAKIAALQNHFEHLTVSFRVEKDLQKITLQQCEDLKQQVSALQSKERQYLRQLEGLEDSRIQLENQSSIIADLQADKRALEERIASLHTNLFQGDTMEALRHKQLLQEHAASILKLQTELEEKDRVIKTLNQTNTSLIEKSQYNEQLLRDKKDLIAENSQLRTKCTELTEKLIVFSVDSGVEVEDLERALDIVRRQREDDAISKLSFLGRTGSKDNANGSESSDPALDTVPALRRKYSELELKTRDYLLEIQQKTDMLNTQYTINKEQKKKLADLTRKYTTCQLELERLRYELAHRPSVGLGGSNDQLSDSIFALSDDGSDGTALAADQLTGLENLIAFRVVSGTLKSSSSVFLDTPSPLTFLTADFYEFEASYSEVFGGFQPEYKFTTQYQVDADQFLLQYLEKEELIVTLYQQLHGTNYKKLAVSYIPLRGLLTPSAAIEGRAQLLRIDSQHTSSGVRGMLRDGNGVENDNDTEDERIVARNHHPDSILGEIHYILRMKRPILSTPPSPSLSAAGTPVGYRARSRQGSMIAPGIGQFQTVGNTLSTHHTNRDINLNFPTSSRATMQADDNTRSPPSLQSQPQSFPSQSSSTNANRQPSAPSNQSHMTLDDFDSARHSSQSNRRSSLQSQSQQTSLFGSQLPTNNNVTSDRQLRPNTTRSMGGQTNNHNQPQQSSHNPPSDFSRQPSFPSTQPRPPIDPSSNPSQFSQRTGTASGAHSSATSARSNSSFQSGPRTAEEEQADIEELLNNPDQQASLFGNDQNSDRRVYEETF